MKGHRFRNTPRILLILALAILFVWAYLTLLNAWTSAHPDVPSPSPLTALLLLPMLLFLLAGKLLIGRWSGYRLIHANLLLIGLVGEEGRIVVRAPWKTPLGVMMLPPRTDGTSPCGAFIAAWPICCALLTGAMLLLTGILWHTAAAQIALLMALYSFLLALVLCFPRRDGLDALSLLQSFRDAPELRRALACSQHLNVLISRKVPLADMPEELFLPFPPELAANPYASHLMLHRSSRLIRQQQFAQAYDALQPLLSLPDTHEQYRHSLRATAILNAALCEALLQLPPRYLLMLDDPAVAYMLPDTWKPRLALARYAHALCVLKDEEAIRRCRDALKDEKNELPLLALLDAQTKKE